MNFFRRDRQTPNPTPPPGSSTPMTLEELHTEYWAARPTRTMSDREKQALEERFQRAADRLLIQPGGADGLIGMLRQSQADPRYLPLETVLITAMSRWHNRTEMADGMARALAEAQDDELILKLLRALIYWNAPQAAPGITAQLARLQTGLYLSGKRLEIAMDALPGAGKLRVLEALPYVIAFLGSDRPGQHDVVLAEYAERGLAAYGSAAHPALREAAATHPDPTVRARAAALLPP